MCTTLINQRPTLNQLVTEFTEISKHVFYTQKKRGTRKPKGVWSRKGLTSTDKIEKQTYYSREHHCYKVSG